MRKILISLLLASAAASPALAARPDNSDREAARAERQQAREDRQSAREERSAPAERPQASPDRPERNFAPQQQQSVERQQQQQQQQQQQAYQPRSYDRPAQSNLGGAGNARSVEEYRARQQGFAAQRQQRSVEAYRARQQGFAADRQQRVEQRADRLQQIRDNRELRQSTRPLPNVMRTRPPVVSETPRFGTQPPPRVETRHTTQPQWSTNWRHDSRYDWNNWRRHHRSWFHLGFYYDPFGWGYQPYSIGWRLWPSYYRSSFWLSDPWQYRLPYAPPGTRWIRYYDDAILVDMWNGEVVDVIYNFFW